MKRLRTPKEKKSLSYARDCRNVVAESPWGARDAIAKRKRWVNQSRRKAVHQRLSDLSGTRPADPEQVESAIAATPRHGWRKSPDLPLGLALLVRRSRQAPTATGPEPPPGPAATRLGPMSVGRSDPADRTAPRRAPRPDQNFTSAVRNICRGAPDCSV